MAIYSTWWTVLCVDPPARLAAVRGSVGRLWLASAGLVLGLAAGACFALPMIPSLPVSTRWFPAAAALVYYVSTVLERAGGRDWPDAFRTWLAGTFGPLRDLCCALALTLGLYVPTHRVGYLYLGLEILCLELLRHHRAGGAHRPIMAPEQEDEFDWWDWYSWGERLAIFLTRHRVDPRLVGGAEFRMVVFILTPLTGLALPHATVPVVMAAGLLMLVGEFHERRRPWTLDREDFGEPTQPMPALDAVGGVPAARPEPTDAQPAGPRESAESAESADRLSKVGSR